MKGSKWIGIVSLVMAGFLPLNAGVGSCSGGVWTFRAGEKLSFKAYYAIASIYIAGGDATLTATREFIQGKTAYHIDAVANSNSFLDQSFKVRDRYQTYFDSATLAPYKFIRQVAEGDYRKNENVSFNHAAGTAVSSGGVFKIPDCTEDVLAAAYFVRNLDFDHRQPEEKIPFTMFLEDKTYNLYIRYLGKEEVYTRYGKFKAIKLKPLLIEGTLFTGGEKMTVWLSDDSNHLPLRVESPITFGKISADLMDYSNLRYPLTSLINKR